MLISGFHFLHEVTFAIAMHLFVVFVNAKNPGNVFLIGKIIPDHSCLKQELETKQQQQQYGCDADQTRANVFLFIVFRE